MREVTEVSPDKIYNPNTEFSLMHFLGVPLACVQSFRLLGFMVLELWRRHTDTYTHTLTFISLDILALKQ